MDGFLKMSSTERRVTCIQVEERMRLQAASVEKDFWVCWILRELFTLPGIGPHLTFKGGTSLSKAWKLIDRFSEDIDIVIDRGFLGFVGERLSASRINKLRKACRDTIHTKLLPVLERHMKELLPAPPMWSLQ